MGLFASNPPSLVPANQPSAGSVNQTASRLNAGSRAVKDAAAQSMFQSTGGALSSLQDQIDNILRVLRAPIPQPDAYSVADPNGNLIAWIGFNVYNNVVYEGGWFEQLYVGGTNPTDAFLVASGTSLTITDALIILNGPGGATITLDPTVPSFVLNDGVSFKVEISPTVGGVSTTSTAVGSSLQSLMKPDSVRIINSTGHLNVRLQSNSSIHDGRLSIYDNAGNETFIVLGQAGECFAGALFAGMQAVNPFAGSYLQVRTGTDENFSVYAHNVLADGIVLHSFNDAVTLPKGMEFRASTFRFDVGKIGVGVTATYDVDALGDVNAGGVLRVAGTQVVGAQLGSVSAPTINTTTATGTAGATYTATEQGMLNQHVTAINQLNTDVANLEATVNTLRSRLSTTGITA